MGSSIPYWAGEYASQHGGRNLGLPATVQWHAKRGMKWHDLDPCILHLLKSLPPPDVLVIHLGSNDMVSEELSSKILVQEIQCTFLRYRSLMPQTKLVWSHILPRLYWHGVPLSRNKKIDKKRKKVNRKAAAIAAEVGGYSVSHPNISIHNYDLFRYDGTHLSNSGNASFIYDLTQMLIQLI